MCTSIQNPAGQTAYSVGTCRCGASVMSDTDFQAYPFNVCVGDESEFGGVDFACESCYRAAKEQAAARPAIVDDGDDPFSDY